MQNCGKRVGTGRQRSFDTLLGTVLAASVSPNEKTKMMAISIANILKLSRFVPYPDNRIGTYDILQTIGSSMTADYYFPNSPLVKLARSDNVATSKRHINVSTSFSFPFDERTPHGEVAHRNKVRPVPYYNSRHGQAQYEKMTIVNFKKPFLVSQKSLF